MKFRRLILYDEAPTFFTCPLFIYPNSCGIL
jgi:hypothetical protein